MTSCARPLVGREIRGGLGQQVLGVGRRVRARLQAHGGDRHLSQPLVVDAEHGGLGHGRMIGQRASTSTA